MNRCIVLFLLCFILGVDNKKQFDWKANLIPIVGQIKNKKYVKAAILSGAQFYVVDKFLFHNDRKHISKRNTYAWWMVSLYLYGIIDAYVDYSLKKFPNENKKEE